MIICVCRNINESAVESVLPEVDDANEVHGALGEQIQCGKCLKHIEGMCKLKNKDV